MRPQPLMRKLTSTRAEGALILMFTMAEGDSFSSFSETETDLMLSVSVYYSTKTVTPHSIASLSLPVQDSDGIRPY